MTNKSIPQVKIVNVETGEEIIRDANAEELAQMQTDAENEAAKKATESQRAADRAALLAQLGITEEQAKLLLG
jgi:DNA-binding protein YbaB